MNLLIFGGNSLRHKQWIRDVAAALGKEYASTRIHEYTHWETGEPEIDLAHELSKIPAEVSDFAPYIVCAKSIGSVLSMQALHRKILQPKACVFAGLPLKVIKEHDLPMAEWLADVTIPITIIQNEHDPLGGYEEVLAYLLAHDITNCKLEYVPGDTHDYNDFALLATMAARHTL